MLDLPIAIFLIVVFLSAVFSVNVWDSWLGYYGNPTKGFLAIICYVVFYYLVVNNIDAKKAKIYLWSFFASIIIISLYSLMQILGVYCLPFLEFTKYKNFNQLGNLSALSIFSIITFPILVVLAGQTADFCPAKGKCLKLIKLLAIIFSILALAILFLIHSFVFWPAAIVSTVVVLMFYLSKIINISRANLVISSSAFVILVIFLVINNFNWLNLNLSSEYSLSRSLSWQITKQSLKADPLFGSGVATFYYDFTRYKGQDFNQSYLWNNKFDNAAGFWLESLASIGIIGTLSFLAILLTLLMSSYQSLVNEKDKTLQAMLLPLFSSLIGITILSALFPLPGTVILCIALLLILLAGLTVYSAREEKYYSLTLKASPQHALLMAAIFLSLAAGVIFLLVMGGMFYLADIFAQKSFMAADLGDKINYINKAQKLNPYRAEYFSSGANYYFAMASQEMQGGKNQNKISDYINSAISQEKMSVEIANNKPESHIELGLIYENSYPIIQDGLTLAREQYKKAQEIEPDSPISFLRLANLEAVIVALAGQSASGQSENGQPLQPANAKVDKIAYDPALKLYSEALSRKNDYAEAYYGKAMIYIKLNNSNEAIKNLEQANMYSPQNINYLYNLALQYSKRGLAKELAGKKENKQTDQPIKLNANQDLAGAEQIFKGVISLEPKHENAYYNLTQLYYKTGNKNDAKKTLKSLFELVKDENAQKEIRKQFPGI